MATALPYENATSGDKALSDIWRILRAFGCSKFGSMVDEGAGTIMVQFAYRGREVTVEASIKGYAAAWLRRHPMTHNHKCSRAEYEKRATKIAGVAVYSICRDWIKGQVTAIETGILSFEGAFLGQLRLGNGKTVLQHVSDAGVLQAIEGPQ